MAADIGTAYVKIEPTAKGISKKIEGEMSSAGAAGGSAFSSGFGKVIGTTGKILAGAAAAGATAVAGIVTSATKSFADYEQLVGGVETLFGSTYNSVEEYAKGVGISMDSAAQTFEAYQNRQQKVFDNADKAYMTAGLSANDYMETVTSFAASLNASLGEYAWQSANYADTAVGDMADNANKMGSSMESIQNAYQGFAKGNFTMLDNLKLGYGGTKTEMERMMRDAEELEGLTKNSLKTDNFADVIDAIHIIQENLGITGTTAKEASTTIQGSFASMKAEWDNLLTAMSQGDGWDMGVYIENFLDTVKTFAGNVMPVVQQSLVGVSSLISGLAPEIAAAIPQMVSQVLPGLLESGVQIIDALGQGLLSAIPALMPSVMQVINGLLQTFLQMAPQILQVGVDIILQLAQGITEALPSLIPTLTNAVLEIVTTLTDPGTLTSLIQAGIDLLMALLDGLMQALPQLIEALPTIVQNLCDALVTNVPVLIEAANTMVNMLVEQLPTILEALTAAAPQIITALMEAVIAAGPQLIAAGPQITAQLIIGIVQSLPQLVMAAVKIIDAIVQGLASAYATLTAEGPKMIDQLKAKIMAVVTKLVEVGREVVKQIIEGLKSFASNLYSKGVELMSKLKEKIVGAVKGFAEVGKKIVEGVKEGLSSAWEGVVSWFKEKIEALKKSIGNLKDLLPGKSGGESKSNASSVDSAVDSVSQMAVDAMVSSSINSAEMYQATSTSDPMYELLAQYLPLLLNKKTEVDLELQGGMDRFFRAMQGEARKNNQLTGATI